ncbi:extensin family protein [Jannaschia aquimarina]|uniref:Extensin-like C-terminal domain-containing protein n=1 Tax=Jannaschia aquimarina TaxID=935700 RepID=A0A0D1D310_9RHOB|nr:extensin family protein [Jannaschia aquimarina]KIT14498.1 hypothetical protein jaqu_37880 [Jannaschia aquimarina]SNT28520.1 Uncharacterized conserved protein [Jannaschia aquimarina]
MKGIATLLAIAVALPAFASPRPVPRPAIELIEPALRPLPRPERAASAPSSVPTPRPDRGLRDPADLAETLRKAIDAAEIGAEVLRTVPSSRGTVAPIRLATPDPALATPAPKARPAGLVEVLSQAPARPAAQPAVATSVRPVGRVPEDVREARAMFAMLSDPVPRIDLQGLPLQSDRPQIRPAIRLAAARRANRQQGGGLCGSAAIAGERIDPVPGPGACGIQEAVRVRSVAGVGLSRPARMDCGTARALETWVRTGLIPTVGGRGGGATRIEVAAGYACRNRNNRSGGRLSEHAKGRAIDISGIRLANGETLSVLRDWGQGAEGRILAALWRAACGPFGTVLGPNSDRYHRDHFHFDTARYRSGSFCR